MPKRKILSCLAIVLFSYLGKAQSLSYDSVLTKVLQSDALLPLLIDSAIKNSPEIKHAGSSVKYFEENLQTTKKSVLNVINLGASYNYGNVGNLALEKDYGTSSQYLLSSNLKTSRYNLGFGVAIPVGTFLSRKNVTKAAEMQVEMAEENKDNIALQVKQQVIKLYQDFKLAHTVMLTVGKMKQTLYASVSMNERNFKDAQISLEQLSKAQNEYSQAQMDYDVQVNKFQTSFLLLEAYTGVQLAKLINGLR